MMNFSYAFTVMMLDSTARVSTAGTVTLLGMGAIFTILAILWGAIEIMHRLLHGSPNQEAKDTKPSGASKAEPNEQDAAVAAAIAAAIAATEDDGAVVAAITAAITAARAEEGNTSAFRVVSFKRAKTSGSRGHF